MRRSLAAAALLVIAGCATGAPPDQGPRLRGIVASAVQLRAERDGGSRRTASGVVIAADVAGARSWILTTRHFLEPPAAQRIVVQSPARKGPLKAAVAAVSDDSDLAILVIDGVALPPATLRDRVQLGDAVWVVSFPWGRRLTVVSGIVSQIAGDDGEVALEGAARLVDAPATYGTSGGGVFDPHSGELIGLVEGYRTARVTLQAAPERTLDLPVPGETTVLPAATIRRFLRTVGIGER